MSPLIHMTMDIGSLIHHCVTYDPMRDKSQLVALVVLLGIFCGLGHWISERISDFLYNVLQGEAPKIGKFLRITSGWWFI